jgi:DNA polymerase
VAEDTEARIEQLDGWIRACVQCPLHQSRKNAVPGEGPADAGVMLIGEAPGAREDEQGRPFVGPAGDALDEVLAEVGIERAELYITSVVKCRPPENRNPHTEEFTTCCALWLERQIELIDPDMLVAMGKVAMRAVLDERGKLEDLHGRTRRAAGRPCMITYHPAASMRFPQVEARFREDLRKLKADIE